MPKLVASSVPSYRLHKQSGQAIVTLNARDICLGKHGTNASQQEYNRLIAEWLANGRRLPSANADRKVAELILAFWHHAQTYYRKPDGAPTSEIGNYRDVLKPLRRVFGHTAVSAFGPLSLKALCGEMIRLGWCRTNINRQVARIRHLFKWGVENELVPPSVYQGLTAVAGLRLGRTEARESTPVKPVPEATVAATLPFLSRQVAGMVSLQLWTGMRPGEVTALRGIDVDTSGEIWTYKPQRHKTQHHGHERVIYIGPKAQAVVEPFLKPNLTEYLFAPADAERERRAVLNHARKTPASCGNTVGTNRTREPKRVPGARYAVEAYCKAVYAACDAAFPPPAHLIRQRVPRRPGSKATRQESMKEWRARIGEAGWTELRAWQCEHRWHPHQLRHTAATRLRKEYGLEAARVVLGHRSAAVAEVYAEIDQTKARRIMSEAG